MKITSDQKQLIALTLQLDLKAHEYKDLCAEFEALQNTDNNTEKLKDLKERLLKNQEEIKQIQKQLKELQN